MIPFTRVLQLHVYGEYIILQQSYRELDNLTREKHPHAHIRTRINVYTHTHTHTLNISDDDLSPLHYLLDGGGGGAVTGWSDAVETSVCYNSVRQNTLKTARFTVVRRTKRLLTILPN